MRTYKQMLVSLSSASRAVPEVSPALQQHPSDEQQAPQRSNIYLLHKTNNMNQGPYKLLWQS